MRREPPDPGFYAEIRDLNLECLRLVIEGRRGVRPVLGLDSAIVEQISRLTSTQLEAVAGTPCLLAALSAVRPAGTVPDGIAEPLHESDARWLDATRVFTAGLITYVWQTARRDPLLAGLCVGPVTRNSADPATLSFRDVRRVTRGASHHLEARFYRHARFWPDLIRACRDGNAERVRLAQLTGIQLALAGSTARAALRHGAESWEPDAAASSMRTAIPLRR